jgi:NDP-sugar pyrophosphorylase family protein
MKHFRPYAFVHISKYYPYTDEFVVIEGDMTFALEPKEFYLQKYVSELQSFVKLRQHHVHIDSMRRYPTIVAMPSIDTGLTQIVGHFC